MRSVNLVNLLIRNCAHPIFPQPHSSDFIFVVDDNFFGVGPQHAEYAKELLRQIIKRGKKRLWFSQTTINMGADDEGLRLAYKAGCRGMLIGFERSPSGLEPCLRPAGKLFMGSPMAVMMMTGTWQSSSLSLSWR